MGVEVISKEDLEVFRRQLVEDIKGLIIGMVENQIAKGRIEKGYKTSEVCHILGCCRNTLVALRIARKLRTKKIGRHLYYNKEDIAKLVREGF